MLILLGVITSRATSGGRGKDRNTSGQRGNNFNRSYRNISVVVVENDVVKPKCQQYTSLHEMLSNFSKVLIVQISFTAVINNGGIGGIRKAPRRIIFTFFDLLCDVRDEKRKQSRGAQIIHPSCPKKFSKFSQLRLFLFVGPAKPLWSLVFVQPLTTAYKYRRFELTCKTPRRSLQPLHETRRRVNKFYNNCSQSAAHQFSLKHFFKKIRCDSYSQFFYASCLDIPFVQTLTEYFTSRQVQTLSFHPDCICSIEQEKNTSNGNRIILTSASLEKRSRK